MAMRLACTTGVPGSNLICITLSPTRELHALLRFHHTNAEILSSVEKKGTRSGACGEGTALQVRRSQVRIPNGAIGFSIGLILPGDSASIRSEYQGHLLGVGVGGVNGGQYLGLTTSLT
jgi:hypothetical protein